jgi:hypothetical protein
MVAVAVAVPPGKAVSDTGEPEMAHVGTSTAFDGEDVSVQASATLPT